MVGILLKIGEQSENVGEKEVFGRFCIRDVTENPSGGLLRRADIRPPDLRLCPQDTKPALWRVNTRRISGLRRAGSGPRITGPTIVEDLLTQKMILNY